MWTPPSPSLVCGRPLVLLYLKLAQPFTGAEVVLARAANPVAAAVLRSDLCNRQTRSVRMRWACGSGRQGQETQVGQHGLRGQLCRGTNATWCQLGGVCISRIFFSQTSSCCCCYRCGCGCYCSDSRCCCFQPHGKQHNTTPAAVAASYTGSSRTTCRMHMTTRCSASRRTLIFAQACVCCCY